MSYQTIKKGVGDLLEELTLSPSSELISFIDASPNEYGNTYILTPLNGILDEEAHGEIGSRLYDIQEWSVQVAFAKGTYSAKTALDKLNYKREDIIQKLDNPASWTSFARMLRYKNWELQELPDYFVLIINIEIVDIITY